MNDLGTALASHFVKLGSNQQNASITQQIYIDLSEVRKLFDVNYCFDNDMKRMYITAKNSKSESESLYFPISTFENISFKMMKQIINLSNSKSAYLAIISPDSTCVYYEICNGLTELTITSSSHTSKLKERQKHDIEISQKCDDIYQLVNKNIST